MINKADQFPALDESAIRMLTDRELEAVAGGDGYGGIVVIGNPGNPGSPVGWEPGSPPGSGGGSGGGTDHSKAAQTLHMGFLNPTADQERLINNIYNEVNNIDANINKLADDAVLTIKMSDGSSTITSGAEVKSLWAKEYITIDAPGTTYPNGTQRGTSTDTNGHTHFNIDLLSQYMPSNTSAAYQGQAADYLILHELGHNTHPAVVEYVYDAYHGIGVDANGAVPPSETVANTVAKAIENAIGLTPLPTVNYGYDPTNPTFQQ